VREAIIDLRAKGLLTVIVTNQSGVARGLFTETNLREFNEHLLRELKPAEIDGVFYCPHHPDGKVATYAISCNCRKPKTGLIDQACSQFGIDRQKSFLVGDKWSDMECAATAGVKGLQVLESGKSNETRHDKAIAFVPSLREAATLIISTL
jgi:D-glycero-D-manno-heptose 1,7-bisphosphate phosphatase